MLDIDHHIVLLVAVAQRWLPDPLCPRVTSLNLDSSLNMTRSQF
jgi:hypothetical protein